MVYGKQAVCRTLFQFQKTIKNMMNCFIKHLWETKSIFCLYLEMTRKEAVAEEKTA